MLSSIVKIYFREIITIGIGMKVAICGFNSKDPVKHLFCSIKNSGEILDKLKARDFNATSLSTYDFSILCTTLSHNFIKDKLIDLIERDFQREVSPYLACNDRNAIYFGKKLKSKKKLKNIMHSHVKMYVNR